MQRTVLIIAHNEATHISECLESLEKQTITPDEIILVAHNCTDETVVIAKKFPNIQIEELYTEEK
jgi:glycosyltransferase involved in cell wall biosynthesis